MAIGKDRADTKWISHSSSRTVEILAVDFLDDSKDIILAGDRQGQISLLDMREPFPKFGKYAIQNPSTVSHIKSIDQFRILVAGPGEESSTTMCQYDIRNTKTTLVNAPRNKIIERTMPYLEYPDHHNTYAIFGLDVDVDAGLVAAAQEDQTVQIFSLHGGQKLDFVGGKKQRDCHVECLRFIPDRDVGTKSLYVAGIDSISRYAW